MTCVVHVCTSAKFVPFVVPLLIGLRSRGYEVVVVTGDGPELGQLAEHGIESVLVPMSREIAPLSDLASVFRLARVLRGRRGSLIHAHNPKAGLLTMFVAYLTAHSPRIYHVHGSPLLTAVGPSRWLFWAAESLAHLTATRVISVSESLREALGAAGVRGARRAKVLARGSAAGIETAPFRAAAQGELGREFRAQHGVPWDAELVGFAGRYLLEKGVRELRDAWSMLHPSRPQTWLMLAGARDGVEPPVMNELRLLPRVIDVGFVRDMPSFLAALDLFVLPSYREGLSTVVLEAMASGTAVVAARAVGIVDVVIPGQTGLLVPARDAAALAFAVQSLLDDPAQRRRLAEAGRALVERDFERKIMLDALVAFYAELGFPPP